jgi:hypothetical protein
MKEFNKNFFEIIDSEPKAYILGILYADGYNWTNGKNKYVSLSLIEEDLELLNKINFKLGGVHSIYSFKSKHTNWKNYNRLQINSKKISKDLELLGCVQNKSKILQFPTFISNELIHHFIRGYFDGDGSVWEGKRHKAIVKDKLTKSGFREKIIHNVKFNITGTESMIIGIQKVMVDNNICKKNKLNKSKNINNCIQLEYSGRQQMKKFYSWLYKDSTIYMERKKLKIESIICANIQ